MHIVVTGGLGFIGSHLCERLLHDGHTVTSIDSAEHASCLPHGLALSRFPRFHDWSYRLDESEKYTPLLPQADVVIHLAAKAGVRASLADPLGYASTNVTGLIHVLEACRVSGVSKVIFASSSSVYGHPEQRETPSRETDDLSPLSLYGATKVAGELLCKTYAALYGMQIICLRLFSVYGPRQRPDLALPIFARQMLTHEPLTLLGDGTSTRDYTYITDVVEGFCSALQSLAQPSAGGRCSIMNIGSGHPVALDTVLPLLAQALRVPSYTLQHAPAHPADAESTHASIYKARTVLGWAPLVSFAEGVQAFANWYLAHPSVPDVV